MFRFAARLLALVLLALAVVLAVLDITRTVTASSLVLTPFNDTLETVRPGLMATLGENVSANLHPVLWDPIFTTLFALPSWLICGALALLLLVASRGRSRPLRRFSSR